MCTILASIRDRITVILPIGVRFLLVHWYSSRCILSIFFFRFIFVICFRSVVNSTPSTVNFSGFHSMLTSCRTMFSGGLTHPDQCGFMAGRFTGDNIRLIYDVLFKANQQKKKGLLVLIDFEKAFDSICWQYMNACLVLFNFGEPFRQWIKLFTSGIKSCVQINGMISSWFPVGRGCRQGDPISPYLFLLCSEILAHIIRKDPDIKGYSLNDIEIKVSQFADDTSLFLDGSREDLQKCFSVLLKFSTFSGLKMNLDKTKCIWFGCVRQTMKFSSWQILSSV